MDIFTLLAESTSGGGSLISESLLRWICGGMATAIAVMAYYMNEMWKDGKAIRESIPGKIKEAENEQNTKSEKIAKELKEEKDNVIAGLKKDVAQLHIEKWGLLEDQLKAAQQNDKDFEELSEDYNILVTDHVKPLIEKALKAFEKAEQTDEELRRLLDRYRNKPRRNE